MTVLETEHLLLRRFQLSDLEAMRVIFCDPEVMRFSSGVKDDSGIRNWLQNCIDEYYCKRDYGPLCVVEKTSDSVIGFCGLFYFDDINGRSEIEIGFRLARAVWGQGYATEAARTVRDFAFQSLKLHRLIMLIDPGNKASIRVAEKTGLVYEDDVMLKGFTHHDRVYVIEQSAE